VTERVLSGPGLGPQATHELGGRDGLLALVQRSPDGTRLGDLADAYPGAADDAAALAAEGRLWFMPGSDRFDGVVFPRAPPPMPVSAAVAAQWHLTEARAHSVCRTRQTDHSLTPPHPFVLRHVMGCVCARASRACERCSYGRGVGSR